MNNFYELRFSRYKYWNRIDLLCFFLLKTDQMNRIKSTIQKINHVRNKEQSWLKIGNIFNFGAICSANWRVDGESWQKVHAIASKLQWCLCSRFWLYIRSYCPKNLMKNFDRILFSAELSEDSLKPASFYAMLVPTVSVSLCFFSHCLAKIN